jgi:hypothetical protein
MGRREERRSYCGPGQETQNNKGETRNALARAVFFKRQVLSTPALKATANAIPFAPRRTRNQAFLHPFLLRGDRHHSIRGTIPHGFKTSFEQAASTLHFSMVLVVPPE